MRWIPLLGLALACGGLRADQPRAASPRANASALKATADRIQRGLRRAGPQRRARDEIRNAEREIKELPRRRRASALQANLQQWVDHIQGRHDPGLPPARDARPRRRPRRATPTETPTQTSTPTPTPSATATATPTATATADGDGHRDGHADRHRHPRDDPLMATEQLFADRYRLERRLGVGGMATVQLAFDTRLERHVAVKLLAEHLAEDSSFVSRFRREALAAARLVHPNIVQVFDFGSEYVQRAPVHRHGVRRRPLVRGDPARPRPARPARRGRHPRPGLPRARLRPSQRRRAPRRQAGQPAAQHRRRGQAGRLRHRQGGRAVGHHQGRLGARHGGLPVARAGARRAGRPGL